MATDLAGPTGSHRRPPRRGRRRERGSIALEMAFAAPIVLLLLALAWTYGRVAWANGHLEAGARDAARVATQSRSVEEARANALAVVQENTEAVTGCGETAAVMLTGTFEPGSTLTIRASCSYSLSDIGLPGAPGTMTPTATFSSVIDQRRGISP
ncbi:TadE family protein [Ornithinimicrobium pratense]|uniref:Pilus assembly protein n=1 Tax=Ornithinimicrobium pratense TaxID=2593973 RepID=A0A5J6V161_9MICO|nr:TadE family protein [Ornithinimicrobium pratense]QFG67430.1 pilus assembly protein [Ornithinimicrobium pratense]